MSSRSASLGTTAAITFGGAVLALAIGALTLGTTAAGHLALPLAISVVATVAATGLAARRLATASLRIRFVAIATFATVVGLANLAILAALMFVSSKDAGLLSILLFYSTLSATGAALAAAASSGDAVEQMSAAARKMAEGDLEARAGSVGGGAELTALALTLDSMAARLSASLQRQAEVEAQRRDLITAVSHDLRTPLGDLQVMSEAIEDGVVDDPATIRAYTAKIGDAVGALSHLIDDLFEFVQLDAGAIETETRQLRLGDAVDAALAACDLGARGKGLALQTDLGEVAGLNCSPRLTRVIQNLLQNAIRHTPADGTVVVAARATEPDRFELSVCDSGEGIDAAIADRIFEPFWRGDSSRNTPGTGLGLALAKRIVEALGGTIAVEPADGGGSRFAIELPTR